MRDKTAVAILLFAMALTVVVLVVVITDRLNKEADRRPLVLLQTDAVDAVLVESDLPQDLWRITYANGDQELIMCKVVDYACR